MLVSQSPVPLAVAISRASSYPDLHDSRISLSDAGTRNPAIATVRVWVPDNKPWSSTIRTFALQVLRRLQSRDAKERGEDIGGVDEKLPEKEVEEADQIAQSRYLPLKLEMPVEQEVVRQHVELLFALTKKIPEFLDE